MMPRVLKLRVLAMIVCLLLLAGFWLVFTEFGREAVLPEDAATAPPTAAGGATEANAGAEPSAGGNDGTGSILSVEHPEEGGVSGETVDAFSGKAQALLGRIPAPSERIDGAALRRELEAFTAEELPSLIAFLEAKLREVEAAPEVWAAVLARWAIFEPAAAYWYSVEEGRGGAGARHAIMHSWAARNTAGLRAFLEAYANAAELERHARHALPALLAHHPEETLAWLEDLPGIPLKAHGLERAVEVWLQADGATGFERGADWLADYATD
ncbi:MAG: hypothetical protein GVY10_11830, partial [Verrucomicrobia bacterium]|nr:hypothetical protein [Verrucomicrobiota bacterium]